jgi:2'-5' RNA ligase
MPMHAVVSLLDDEHYHLVESLWAELEEEFGVRGVYVTPFPHFSYQVAPQYDVARLEPILARLAQAQRPFHVRTTGLGIFTGAQPVLFIPVVPNPDLARLHQAIWDATLSTSAGLLAYYRPDQWVPHVTLGFGDISPEESAEIVRCLISRDFTWEIAVDNLALIYNTGERQELRTRFAFGE